jgi:hypothetical protein
MEVDMTNLKQLAASVAFMTMTATTAVALDPAGSVYTPDGAPKNAPYWQYITIETGDRHWTYASSFLDQAQLRGVVKGVTIDGFYFPPEAVVMNVIKKLNGADKFGTDRKGYPTFKLGETYRLPVPSAAGFTVPPAPVTQAELLAQMVEQKQRYSALQATTEGQFNTLTERLNGMDGRIDVLKSDQDALQGRVEGLSGDVATAQSAADYAKTLAGGAITTANQATEAVKALRDELSTTVQAQVRTQLDARLNGENGLVQTMTANAETAATTAANNAVDAAKPEMAQVATDAATTEAKRVATDAANNAVKEATGWTSWSMLVSLAAVLIAASTAVGFGLLWWRSPKTDDAWAGTVAAHEESLNGEKGLVQAHQALDEKHDSLAAEVRDQDEGLPATHAMAATALASSSALVFDDTSDLKLVNEGKTAAWTMTDGHQRYKVLFTKRDDDRFDWTPSRNADGTGTSEPVTFKSVENMQTKLRHAHANGRLHNCIVPKAPKAPKRSLVDA